MLLYGVLVYLGVIFKLIGKSWKICIVKFKIEKVIKLFIFMVCMVLCIY